MFKYLKRENFRSWAAARRNEFLIIDRFFHVEPQIDTHHHHHHTGL